MRFFDPDGPLMTALSKLADIVICNAMFIVFSLPLFTIGASLTALMTCMQQLIEEDAKDDGLIFRTFWYAFRSNFKQATALWLICLLGIGFLTAYWFVAQSLGGAYGRVYQVTFYLLVLLFLVGFLYIFPLQARYTNSVRNTLRNAWLLSVAALPITAAAVALLIAALYISFVMNPAAINVFGWLWAVCGFGIMAYLESFLFRRAFRKLSPELLTKKKSAQAEGAIFTDEEHREEDLMVQESSFSDPNWNRRDDLFPETKTTDKKTGKRSRR